MKFTVRTEPFRRMLEMLAQGRSSGRRKCVPVRLEASRGRLCVQHDQLTAEIDSWVWQDGRCAASFARLLEAVETCAGERTLTVEADLEGERLRVGDSLLPCVPDQAPVVPMPEQSRIFFASDLGVVPSSVPELALG